MPNLSYYKGNSDSRFKFTGKELDQELDINLYYFGARYYDPALPRWTSVDPLADSYVDLSSYNYCGNQPLTQFDPDGRSITIDSTGSLTNEEDKKDEVYYWDSKNKKYATLKDADGANITESDFLEFVATVYAETSGNKEESYAIANVIYNRAKDEDTDISEIVNNTGIYGHGSKRYKKVLNSYRNEDKDLKEARAGVVNALSGGKDYSKSAYFWEATTYLKPTSKNYKPKNWFVRMGWGTTQGTESGMIHYLVTTTIGATTFMKNNPRYHGKRNYP